MTYILAHDQLLGGGSGISRRDFVRGIGFALAGGALLAIGGQLIAPHRLPEVPVERLMRSTFAALLGEMFQVYPESTAVPGLRLAKVRNLRAAPRKASPAPMDARPEHSFSLLFTGPIDRMVGQGTYRFEHERLGSFTLFIVPLAPDRNAGYYEAIFNRL